MTETAHFKPSPPAASRATRSGFAPPLLLAPEGLAELKLNSGGGCSNVASFELHSNAETPNQSGPIERVNSDSGEVAETERPEPTTESLGDATARSAVAGALAAASDGRRRAGGAGPLPKPPSTTRPGRCRLRPRRASRR